MCSYFSKYPIQFFACLTDEGNQDEERGTFFLVLLAPSRFQQYVLTVSVTLHCMKVSVVCFQCCVFCDESLRPTRVITPPFLQKPT